LKRLTEFATLAVHQHSLVTPFYFTVLTPTGRGAIATIGLFWSSIAGGSRQANFHLPADGPYQAMSPAAPFMGDFVPQIPRQLRISFVGIFTNDEVEITLSRRAGGGSQHL